MPIVTGDRYLEELEKFVEQNAGALLDGALTLKLNPVGLQYLQQRLEALQEIENMLAGAAADYVRGYISDLGNHHALEQLRRFLRLLTSLKVVSTHPPPTRDPTPLWLQPFVRLRVLEIRGCDLSTSAARGLIELRHTLEKVICHNSTDALKHIFASRFSEMKDSPLWSRLSFVSCPWNHLILMDESLQLLPVIETLDLSRNNLAIVDNLHKCSRLKHVNLGFNQLRTVAAFNDAYYSIRKVILRNNALTSLRGIENLKSLEALDVSYNVISNFTELEFLSCLRFLNNLWLEGNPLCCTRWYRAHAYSYFLHPRALKLDDKAISIWELLKRKIIICSKLKQPSFGFYFPAREISERESSPSTRKGRLTRLASIESEGESSPFSPDSKSPLHEIEIKNTENDTVDDPAVADLISKIELLKNEHSGLWLLELSEWMKHESMPLFDSMRGDVFDSQKRNEYGLDTGSKKTHQPNWDPCCSTVTQEHVYHEILDDHSDSEDEDYADSEIRRFSHEASGTCDIPSCSRTNVRASEGRNGLLTSSDSIENSTCFASSPHHKVTLTLEMLKLPSESSSVAGSDCDTSTSGEDLQISDMLSSFNSITDETLVHNLESKNETLSSVDANLPDDNDIFANNDTTDILEKRVRKKKPKRRVVSLSECPFVETSGQEMAGNFIEKNEPEMGRVERNDHDKVVDHGVNIMGASRKQDDEGIGVVSRDMIERYYDDISANLKLGETHQHCLHCEGVLG